MFNFIFAFIILLIVGFISGNPNHKPIVSNVSLDSPAYEAGLRSGDRIVALNNIKTNDIDRLLLEYQINYGNDLNLRVLRNNETLEITPMTQWGNKDDYEEMFYNFENIKKTFLDKKIPVIINEIGVLTEEKKEPKSIREYLYTAFSITTEYDSIMACLWDTSKKGAGNMNFYDKENDR